MSEWIEGSEAANYLKKIAVSGMLATDLKFRNANCSGQSFKGLSLAECALENITFQGSDLEDVRLSKCSL